MRKRFPRNSPLGKAAALLVCLCLAAGSLSGCAPQITVAADRPVTPPVRTQAPSIPCLDDAVLHDDQTLYRYYAENCDTIGWLTIDGIRTDHVVMLGQKKAYARGDDGVHHYLHYDFHHQASSYGALYADFRCHVTYGDMSQNVTVYGHHMRDGTMLAGLENYRAQSYFEEHQYITFHTLWQTVHFRVFGVFAVNLKVKSDAAFDYRQPDYESPEAFLSFVQAVKDRSFYDTGVDVQGDDRIITLSTCTYPTGNPAADDARLVVMGRLCTPEEEAALQTAEAADAGQE